MPDPYAGGESRENSRLELYLITLPAENVKAKLWRNMQAGFRQILVHRLLPKPGYQQASPRIQFSAKLPEYLPEVFP
jgi:hypothetical protein